MRVPQHLNRPSLNRRGLSMSSLNGFSRNRLGLNWLRTLRSPQGLRSRPRRVRVVGAAFAVLLGSLGAVLPLLAQTASADSTSSLPACPFWTTATPPQRSVTPWVPPLQTAPAGQVVSLESLA